MISSGLGKVFPEGYPVARVSQVIRDESRPFARVVVTPLAQLDRLRHLLLLWKESSATDDDSIEEKNRGAEKNASATKEVTNA